MMRCAAYLLFAALVLMIATPAVAGTTLGELDAWCAPPDQGGNPPLCKGYLDSGLELLASPDKSLNDGIRACVPKGEDRGKVVSLLRTYARSHPAAHSLDLVDGLGLMLKERYPCR